jgi:DNA-binding beta-propeller fold protein YncE
MKSTQQRAIGDSRIAFLTLTVVLLVASAVCAAERKKEIYVVNSKPPSVSIIDSESWQLSGSIPLSTVKADPTHALMGPGNRFLYVLHHGSGGPFSRCPKAPSELSVLDLNARGLVREVPLGWAVSNLWLPRDERYLIAFGVGRLRKGKPKGDEELASVAVIDTQNNEVTFRASGWRFGRVIGFTGDASRIFVLAARQIGKGESVVACGVFWGGQYPLFFKASEFVLSVFKDRSEKPLAEIAFEHAPSSMAFSRDEKWLYILDSGKPSGKPKKHRNGLLYVVEVESSKLVASYDVGYFPRGPIVRPQLKEVLVLGQASANDRRGKLYRLVGSQLLPAVDLETEARFLVSSEDPPGLWVGSEEGMSFLPDGGSTPTRRIVLKAKEGIAPPPGLKGLVGAPIWVLNIPKQRKVAVLTADHKLFVANLQEERLDHVAEIGRGSVRAGKLIGKVAIAAGLLGLVFTPSPVFFVPTGAFWSSGALHALVATPDGRFLYALDTASNDVTIVNSEDGSVLDYIPVGSDCMGLLLTSDGRFIWAIARTRLTLIDTASNKQRFQHEFAPAAGRLQDWKVLPENGNLLLLFDNELQVWDPEQASSLATIKGLSEARLLVLPREAK